jgi:integrase
MADDRLARIALAGAVEDQRHLEVTPGVAALHDLAQRPLDGQHPALPDLRGLRVQGQRPQLRVRTVEHLPRQLPPLFREVNGHGKVGTVKLSDKTVARVVKRAVAAAGLDPAQYGGRSLRAGLATAAAKAGRTERTIMKQTGHRSERMVRKYVRDAELFTDDAAAGLL